ncbi:MAG: HI0074 family nucleotidyltransferase substrate-binding subunit [Candidatus Chromulinivorax sp.]|nr:HI0074 family nucleotidyltransferase substrate-binding subunit [Candidatus Chromulinivorax sp.]
MEKLTEKLIYKHERVVLTLHALERSIKTFLRTDIDEEIRESLVASVIKHLEMCYEASWKFLKVYIELHFEQKLNSPKTVFRQCFTFRLLNEQTVEILLDVNEIRNTLTHTYNEETAQAVCTKIDEYYKIFKKVSDISIEPTKKSIDE